MHPSLAVAALQANAHILQRAAETGHGVPLEMAQHDGKVIIEPVFAHIRLLDSIAMKNGERRFAG